MGVLGKEEQISLEEVVDNLQVKEDNSNKTLVIDADTIAYATCSVCEAGDDESGYIIDLDYALEVAKERIEGILVHSGCKDLELHFTYGKNFRFTITDTYKANRKGDRTPEGLTKLKELLCDNYTGFLHETFEADDVVVQRKKFNPDGVVMASPDKDVYNGIEGVHFNYFRRAKGGNLKVGIPMRWIHTTEKEALVWAHMQVLMGDSSDGIQGIKRCGPAKALDILVPELKAEITTLKKEFKATQGKDADVWKHLINPNKLLEKYNFNQLDLWEAVVTAYEKADMSESEAILNMRLISMHQMSLEGELDLWVPPREDSMEQIVLCECGWKHVRSEHATCTNCGKMLPLPGETTIFQEERSKTGTNSTRYGKDILDNFDVETDLVVWDINNEFDQVVTFEHPEIIGRCPVSGFPDTYTAKFSFVTDKLTMELKAFKLWLNSYYNKQVSHEYLCQEIFSIFWKKVQPKYLKVELYPSPRGNVTTTIVCEKYDTEKEINGEIR